MLIHVATRLASGTGGPVFIRTDDHQTRNVQSQCSRQLEVASRQASLFLPCPPLAGAQVNCVCLWCLCARICSVAQIESPPAGALRGPSQTQRRSRRHGPASVAHDWHQISWPSTDYSDGVRLAITCVHGRTGRKVRLCRLVCNPRVELEPWKQGAHCAIRPSVHRTGNASQPCAVLSGQACYLNF
jgi:hypothetical protein